MEAILARALDGRRKAAKRDHVFLNRKGHPWEYKYLYSVVENYHDERHWTGAHITFRDLRKSFATDLAMNGCPPNVLKELLGHSDIAMTLGYYVQVDKDKMREWAAKRWG